MSVGAVNKQTGERIPTAGLSAVDSVLSGTSTNPVQNKVVKEALDGKQDALTFDDTPTYGSNNPVKSNGIYDALATKANTDMVAADFNAGTSYTAGNYCVQDGKLYKFKNNHSGAWSSADVDEVKITGELSALRSGLTVQTLTPVFNTDAVTNTYVHAYRVGQMVFVEMEYNPVSGTIATNTAILSLLPPPLSELWSVYDGYTTLKIDPDGILKYWYPTDTTTLTRRGYSFSYIAA